MPVLRALRKEFTMTKKSEIITRWTKIAQDMLFGKKITGVRYMSDEEAEQLGWDEKCVVIELDDGNIIYPSSDDEGNNAGALFTNDEKEPVLPVIRRY
jgi:hypothetical protein